MVKKVQVSRAGFTRCPSCHSHMKVAAKLAETSCPFCGASILAESRAEGALKSAARALMTGRSSIIAASLFGSVALTSCGETPTSTATGGQTTAGETTGGGTTEGGTTEGGTTEGETTGGSTEDAGVTGEDAVEPEPQPEYGVPPIEEEDASEPEPANDYGGPGFDDGNDG